MEYSTEEKLEWIVYFIYEFGKKYDLTMKQAFGYLQRFKAIDFIDKHYGYAAVLSQNGRGVMMRLYHGTTSDFNEIDLTKSKPGKDFGRGFYLSAELEQAKDFAQTRALLLGGSPVIASYEFDEKLLTSNELKVKTFEDYTEEWANFILANRNNTSNTSIHDYDVVIGPIANDRVGIQLVRFSNHDIDMSTLIRKLKFMKGVTIQYYFGTERAIKHLKRL